MKVAILLATYNGESHLQEQLESILKQSHGDWFICASDDGSSDKTITILENFMLTHGEQRMKIFSGPRTGFSSNFMSLVRNHEILADYYAFCDQDDIWHSEKLNKALGKLARFSTVPAMYCSRTRLIDEQGNFIGLSALIRKPPSFSNALVQNIAGGNTMVFNNIGRNILLNAGMQPVVAHDWWLYMIIAGVGGHVLYDSSPSIDYRQHAANIIGHNGSLRARITRIDMGMSGRFKSWIEVNANAVEDARHLLTPESQALFSIFQRIRTGGRLRGVTKLMRSGLHRQTIVGNAGLCFAVLLNRF